MAHFAFVMLVSMPLAAAALEERTNLDIDFAALLQTARSPGTRARGGKGNGPSPSPPEAQPTMVPQEGPGQQYCRRGTDEVLWSAVRSSLEDCKAKCLELDDCKWMSWWSNKANLCWLTKSCERAAAHETAIVSIMSKFVPPTPLPTPQPTAQPPLVPWEILQEEGKTYCKRDGDLLFKKRGASLEECKAKCLELAECKWVSWWKNGKKLCRLTRSCERADARNKAAIVSIMKKVEKTECTSQGCVSCGPGWQVRDDGSCMHPDGQEQDEIPRLHSMREGSTCGSADEPRVHEVLGKCVTPLAGSLDLRGTWTGRTADGKEIKQRIEQCGDRFTVVAQQPGDGPWMIHDFVHVDGTEENGCNDYNGPQLPKCTPIRAKGTFREKCMVMTPTSFNGSPPPFPVQVERCLNEGKLEFRHPGGIANLTKVHDCQHDGDCPFLMPSCKENFCSLPGR